MAPKRADEADKRAAAEAGIPFGGTLLLAAVPALHCVALGGRLRCLALLISHDCAVLDLSRARPSLAPTLHWPTRGTGGAGCDSRGYPTPGDCRATTQRS